jgi:hypothetical protein
VLIRRTRYIRSPALSLRFFAIVFPAWVRSGRFRRG